MNFDDTGGYQLESSLERLSVAYLAHDIRSKPVRPPATLAAVAGMITRKVDMVNTRKIQINIFRNRRNMYLELFMSEADPAMIYMPEIYASRPFL